MVILNLAHYCYYYYRFQRRHSSEEDYSYYALENRSVNLKPFHGNIIPGHISHLVAYLHLMFLLDKNQEVISLPLRCSQHPKD